MINSSAHTLEPTLSLLLRWGLRTPLLPCWDNLWSRLFKETGAPRGQQQAGLIRFPFSALRHFWHLCWELLDKGGRLNVMVVFVVGSDYWSLRMLQAVLRTGCMDMIFRSHYACQSLASLLTPMG